MQITMRTGGSGHALVLGQSCRSVPPEQMVDPETATVPIYHFSDLTMYVGQRRVLRDGDSIELNGLTFDFLQVLVESAPNVVTHDELAAKAWAGRTVSPETIGQRAKMLRAALQDDAEHPRYFEVVRGQGYRLLPDVGRIDDDTPKRERAVSPRIVAVIVGVLVCAIGIYSWWPIKQPGPSVAVLPFQDLSPAGDQQYLAEGITEELTSELYRLRGLKVANYTSAFALRGGDESLQSIGSQLGVGAVLKGSIRKDGDKLRVTAQLIDTADGYSLWSQTYDRQLSDVFRIQEEIARTVAGALGVQFGLEGRSAYRGAGTANVQAYDLYLRANVRERIYLTGVVTREEQLALLPRAVELDPDYGEAWAALGYTVADVVRRQENPEYSSEVRQQALEYVQKAVALAPDAPDVHRMLAFVRYFELDWIGAEQAFDRSLELQYDWRPLFDKGRIYLQAGRMADALRINEGLLDSSFGPVDYDPDDVVLFFANLSLGRLNDAKEAADAYAVDNVWKHRLDFFIALQIEDDNALRDAMRAMPETYDGYKKLFVPVLEAWGDRERVLETLRAVLEDRNGVWFVKYQDIALLAAYFGDPELALNAEWRNAFEYRANLRMLWFPVMAEVRQLPEFKKFVTDINLVAYWREYGWADACRPLGNDDFICQ